MAYTRKIEIKIHNVFPFGLNEDPLKNSYKQKKAGVQSKQTILCLSEIHFLALKYMIYYIHIFILYKLKIFETRINECMFVMGFNWQLKRCF